MMSKWNWIKAKLSLLCWIVFLFANAVDSVLLHHEGSGRIGGRAWSWSPLLLLRRRRHWRIGRRVGLACQRWLVVVTFTTFAFAALNDVVRWGDGVVVVGGVLLYRSCVWGWRHLWKEKNDLIKINSLRTKTSWQNCFRYQRTRVPIQSSANLHTTFLFSDYCKEK